ncbi:glycosyl hydrolase [Staphylococcus carnosus]|nr:glycosyl hydrolase [Staphylococcus carnosus]
MTMKQERDYRAQLEQLSLEDKATLLTAANFWNTARVPGVNEILLSDGPSGIRKQTEGGDALGLTGSVETIAFPCLALIASTFDKDLLRKYGEYLGQIAKAEKVNVLLGPGMNIKRSPLAGRNFEYFSEDPFLTAELAIQYIKGVESQGIGTSPKHFAANNRENERFTSSSNIQPRSLHEIYLSAFKRVVEEAQPATIMNSYNKVNHVLVAENNYLLTDLLRNQWNFDGVVVSDWGAVKDRVASVRAGLDLEMPGQPDYSIPQVVEAVRSGKLDEALVDRSVLRLLKLIDRYTLEGEMPNYNKDNYHEFARSIAAQSIVLLQNEDKILPLKDNSSKAVIGAFAKHPRYQAGGLSKVNAYKVVTPFDALEAVYGDFAYADGYEFENLDANQKLIDEAVEAAKGKDEVILFAGFPENIESEGFDKTSIDLPDNQITLIQSVAEVNPNVVVVLQNGSAVATPWRNKVNGLVETYLAGEAVGEATVDVLSGKVNPSGKLAETFPERIQDTPSYLTFNRSTEEENYMEGIFVGYRYYATKDMSVAFPFGHGLSYTDFEYTDSNVKVDNDKDQIQIDVTVKNIGEVQGAEVVQIYLQNRASNIEMAAKELKSFERVELEAGESKTVKLVIPFERLKWFNPQTSLWQIDNGDYTVHVGSSVNDIHSQHDFEITSIDEPPIQLSLDSSLKDIIDLQDTLSHEIDEFGFDQMIYKMTSESNLRVLAEPAPIRMLVMFGLKLSDLVKFVEKCNVRLKTGE